MGLSQDSAPYGGLETHWIRDLTGVGPIQIRLPLVKESLIFASYIQLSFLQELSVFLHYSYALNVENWLCG